MKTYEGVQAQLHEFLTSALDGGEWSPSSPGRFISLSGSHSQSGVSSAEKKSCPFQESNPGSPTRSIQTHCLLDVDVPPFVCYRWRIYSSKEKSLARISVLEDYLQNSKLSRRWRFKSLSSGLWRRVVLCTNISDDLAASIFRVKWVTLRSGRGYRTEYGGAEFDEGRWSPSQGHYNKL